VKLTIVSHNNAEKQLTQPNTGNGFKAMLSFNKKCFFRGKTVKQLIVFCMSSALKKTSE